MKKIFYFVAAVMVASTFASCGNKCGHAAHAADSLAVDTVVVDTVVVDSVAADSIAADSVAVVAE